MLTFVDLFAGAGGFHIGFQQAGWKPLLSVEKWRPAALTHRHNFPEVPLLEAPIESLKKRDIVAALDGVRPDAVIGGPPCQGFSMMGNRVEEDPRNGLVLEFIRFLKIAKPRAFVMENVKGILSSAGGRVVPALLEKFAEAGYKRVVFQTLNAADYGVPQLRQRVFFIGVHDTELADPSLPARILMPEEYATVGSAIMDLVGKENQVANHVPMSHKDAVRKRIALIPEGKGLSEAKVPAKLLKGSRSDFADRKVKDFSHVYKRLDRSKPSGTMVPGHNAFPLHPTEHRSLTVREAARLQTFPDTAVFCGTRQDQCIQVGNAVPPALAQVIGTHLHSILSAGEIYGRAA